MTIAKGTATIGSTVRIRSGSYVSPFFTVTEAMQRIAVPYPAPYGSGGRTLSRQGDAPATPRCSPPPRVLVALPCAANLPHLWRAVDPPPRSPPHPAVSLPPTPHTPPS